jgi:cysteine-rich repeat protein
VQSCVDRLEVGKVYELAVFHAERHTNQSNFRLTLSGFVTQTSQCDWVCGDGIVTGFEVCDDGTENNTGGFGMCNADCLGIGPYCGDGIEDPEHEECDLGELNVGSYDGCNADCTLGPYCGDGVPNGEDEECDAGADNGANGSSCRADCTLAPVG